MAIKRDAIFWIFVAIIMANVVLLTDRHISNRANADVGGRSSFGDIIVSDPRVFWQSDGRVCRKCDFHYNMPPYEKICTKCGEETTGVAYLCAYLPE